MTQNNLEMLAKLVRYYILTGTTQAGSGHPSSSLSATDLMTSLFFKTLKFDLENPSHPNNDRVIFSKGHAAPLLYALYAAAGKLTADEILSLREFTSPLEGHPTPNFRYAEAATGSLGQGLSIGVGMALNAQYLDKLPYRTFVLLGDGEMAEGSVWEAAQIAAFYKLDHLYAIIDVNRWGQSQETMYQHDVGVYAEKMKAFGWATEVVDGHSLVQINGAFEKLEKISGRPKAIVAKTLKGKGVSFLEDKPNWHGKAVPKADLAAALKELGSVDLKIIGKIEKPYDVINYRTSEMTLTKAPDEGGPRRTEKYVEGLARRATQGNVISDVLYKKGEMIATRKAYGEALSRLVAEDRHVISLDGDTKNSTFAEIVAQKYPENFFEMFIAEQNMIGVAVGLARRGKIPFVSTFAAFLTRAFDQIRMASVSGVSIKCVGSHAGVSIGEDGASQMGLEDLCMFRSIYGSTVLYPADAVATEALVRGSIARSGIVYIRTNRPATPVIYDVGEEFPVGGSKVLRSHPEDKFSIVAAGVTLFEALTAHDLLKKEGISVRVIDCYSVKPIDEATLKKAAVETKAILVVEDHWADGGIGDAVLNALAMENRTIPVIKMAVSVMPRSGKPSELMDMAGISAGKIVEKVKTLVHVT